jgi:hypothetical protein
MKVSATVREITIVKFGSQRDGNGAVRSVLQVEQDEPVVESSVPLCSLASTINIVKAQALPGACCTESPLH